MKTNIPYFLLMALFACSCSKQPDNDTAGNKTLQVTVNVISDIYTRAAATNAENLVNKFDIYVFDAVTGKLESYSEGIDASSPVAGNVAGESKVGETTITIEDKNPKNILALANSDAGALALPPLSIGVTEYSDMLNAVTQLQSGNRQPDSPFIMSGYCNGVATNASGVTVSVGRRVSRLTIENLSESDGFVITSLKIENAVDRSYLFRNDYPSSGTFVDYDEIPVVPGVTPVIYVFPQPASTNDMELTVSGTFNAKNFSESIPVIPKQNDVPQDMRHNTTYAVKIVAQAGTISIDISTQTGNDWGDGDDINSTIIPGGSGTGSESADISGAATITFNGLQWMDRNVGAVSADLEGDWNDVAGNFYQWGRNTAFTITGTTETVPGPLTAAEASSAENIGKFITANNNNWLSSTDNTLWQTAASQPCPQGFRLPVYFDLAEIFPSPDISFSMGASTATQQETLRDGMFDAEYITDGISEIYGIKKAGTEYACYMKWEMLTTSGGKSYLRISRWQGDAQAALSGNIAQTKSAYASLGTAETITFPAAGSLVRNDARFDAGSPTGYLWTSTPNNSGTYVAEFNTAKIVSGELYFTRSNALTVRCIKE